MARRTTNIYGSTGGLQIKLYGDWKKAIDLTSGMKDSVKKGYDEGIKEFSRNFLRLIKHHISTGTPPPGVRWQPLSDYSYLSTKSRFPDRHLYYLTGLYYRSVGIFSYRNRTYIGLPGRSIRTYGGATLLQVARWLEYGTKGVGATSEDDDDDIPDNGGIPARPLWAPTLREAGGREKLKKVLLRNIRSQLLKDYGIRANQIKIR